MKLPEILQNKWLLRAAFARVERWHWVADAAPWSQLTAFRLDPAKHLGALRRALADESYEPQPWPVIPVPKSSGEIRPYYVPDVADHVVATAFAVLLAPHIERNLKPFVFGNRWYRPVRRERKRKTPVWRERPFLLHSPETFLPYRRDYGLFRRVCHWTASAAVWGRRAIDDEMKAWASRPEEHDAIRIPPFVKNDWWAEYSTRAMWAKVDIEKFFPSVQIKSLNGQFHGFPIKVISKDYSDYQSLGADAVIQRDLNAIFDGAIEWLSAWQHKQVKSGPAGVSPEALGLPTGLTLSALLSNVALAAVDAEMHSRMSPGCGFAVLRFVDDFIVVASSAEKVIEVAGSLRDSFARSGHSFKVNEEKTTPANLFETSKQAQVLKALNNASITRDADPFVTTVVERLSELGRENPAAVVGEPGERRLEELHFLGRTNIADPLMNPETVAAFAVGRLTRSHPTSERNRREVAAIRATVAQVISQHHFKASLWPVVVKAAARRPLLSTEEDDRDATAWLERILRPYRDDDLSAALRDNWWKDGCDDKPLLVSMFFRNRRNEQVTSFLRAAFWNALASALDALDRPGLPGPASWVSRALDASQRRTARQQLAQHGRWAAVLYPSDKQPEFWFERAAHARAVLAARSIDDEQSLPDVFDDGRVDAHDVPQVELLRSIDCALLGRSRRGEDKRLSDWLAKCESPLVRAAFAERVGINVGISSDELGREFAEQDPLSLDSAVRARRYYLGALGVT